MIFEERLRYQVQDTPALHYILVKGGDKAASEVEERHDLEGQEQVEYDLCNQAVAVWEVFIRLTQDANEEVDHLVEVDLLCW